MKVNVTPYLKDIDAEITHHRQTIDRLKVMILDLEDMRALMMQREEARALANRHASPFGTVEGGQIVVRDARLTDHSASLPALTAPPPAPGEADKAQKKRDYHREYQRRYSAKIKAQREGREAAVKEGKSPPPRKESSHYRYKTEVLQLFKSNPKSEFNIESIIDRLQLGLGKGKLRQPLYQALYELRKDGIIHSPGGFGLYMLAPSAPPPVSNG